MEFGSGRLASYLFSFFSRQRVPPEEEPQEEEQAQEEQQQEEQEQEPQEEEQEQQQQQQQQPLPTAFQPHFPSLNRPTTTTTTTTTTTRTRTRTTRTRTTRPRTLYLGPGHSLSSKPTQQQQQQQPPPQNHALNLIKNTTPLRPSPLRNVTLATRTPPETHPTPAKKRKLKPASAIMSAVINQVNREIQTRSPAPSPIKPAEVINPYASLQRRPKQPPPNDPAQAPGESEARKRRLDGWLHPDTPSETRTPPQPPAEAILQQTMPKAYRQDAPARPKRKTGQVGSLPERLLKKQKLREERLRARSPAEPPRRSPPAAGPGPPAETERPTKHTPVTAAAPNPSPDAAPPTGPPPTLTLTAPAATPLQHAEAPAEPRAAVIATVRALPPHHLRASYDLLRGFCAPRPPAPPGLLGGPGDGPVEHVLARVRAVECPRLPTFLLS